MLAQQHLLDVLEAALLAGTPAWAAHVERHRSRPLPAGIDQALTLRVVSSACEQIFASGSAPVQWSTRVGVECIARAGAAVTPDAAVGPLLVDVHARITGANATLQAAGFELRPEVQIEWDQVDLDERIGAAVFIYTVRHRTDHASLAG